MTATNWTRRAVCGAAVCLPSVLSAAPLVDLSEGKGLFTSASNTSTAKNAGLNLFGASAPVPEAKASQHWRKSRFILQNANTDEELTLALASGQRLNFMQRRQLNAFLRDWRKNEIKPIDATVLNALLDICRTAAPGAAQVDVRITSGYRSKSTNDMLHQRSGNVARNSFHIQGRAIDFSMPGVSSRTLARAARKLCPGGVGSYRTFVHIDSGPRRNWSA